MYARIVLAPHPRSVRGFTLIEILVVIGMIAILATVVLVAINPLRQFAEARNSQRQANVSAILNAIGERIAENKGIFEGDSCITLPITATDMQRSDGYDIRPCLVPLYLSELPYDPSIGSNQCVTEACAGASENYDTGYTVIRDPSTARITVCAPEAQEGAITGSMPFCLTR